LTAQQPDNNIVRVALQGLAAVLGGTQSLHTNSFDEALALPTEKAARVALRTQQIIAHESGATDTVDPLAGSYYVEYLTDELESRIGSIMSEVDRRGGALACIETGYFQTEIARSAYEYQKAVEAGEETIVGVNRFQSEELTVPEILRVDADLENGQIDRLQKTKASRDHAAVAQALARVEQAAGSTDNMVSPVLDAVACKATVGEISDRMRKIWGEYEAR